MIENSYQMYQNIFIKDYKSEILSQGNLGLYFSKLPILYCIWGLRTEDCIWTRLLRSPWMMLFFFVNEDEFDFCLIFSRGIFLLSRCQCWENWWQSSSALVLQCNVFLSNNSKILFILELLAALSALVSVPGPGLPRPHLGLSLLLRVHAHRDRVCGYLSEFLTAVQKFKSLPGG